MPRLAKTSLMSERLTRHACAILVVYVVVGCHHQPDDHATSGDDLAADRDAINRAPADAGNLLTFGGHRWTLSGPCASTGDIFRPSMSAICYTTTDDSIRLIELTVDQSSPLKEGVFSRILGVQIDQDGHWISHGPRAEWDLDGGRGETYYVHGELHGTQRHWYRNGQLHIEREWANGKSHGRDRGWYSNGVPQYDSQRVNGEEVSGKAWDENGQPL